MPASGQNKVRADIFSGSLAVFQSEKVASPPEADRCGGRKGGLGGIPPALQILDDFKFFVPLLAELRASLDLAANSF